MEWGYPCWVWVQVTRDLVWEQGVEWLGLGSPSRMGGGRAEVARTPGVPWQAACLGPSLMQVVGRPEELSLLGMPRGVG